MKATERLHWLDLEKFYRAPREEQILILIYAQEREQEELEHATERSFMSVLPIPVAGEAIGTRVE